MCMYWLAQLVKAPTIAARARVHLCMNVLEVRGSDSQHLCFHPVYRGRQMSSS